MVQIIRGGPSRSALITSILGPALGEGLGKLTGDYFANKSLERVLDDKSLEKKPLSDRYSALETALRPHGDRGQKLLQQRIQIEQQRDQEKEQAVLGRLEAGEEITPEQRQRLSIPTQLKAAEINAKRQNQVIKEKLGANVKQSLLKAGYPEETADLWQNQVIGSTQGGLTDTIKQVNDLLRRSKTGKGDLFESRDKPTLKPAVEIPGIKSSSLPLEFPELKEMIGRSASDVIKEETENRKINTPIYGETIDSLNSLEEDYRDITQLQEYNEEPDALPTGWQKWNVDWNTGDLRFKALATPQTQGYVKIIARLLGRAKEYFPGRVTNFDLEQFKTRFPTLANSPEGRRLISEQLALANRIAFLKDETLKASIDHYGAGSDPVQIRKYAQENYRKLKPQLEKELKGIDQHAEQLFTQRESEGKSKIVPMKTPDGRTMNVPSDEVEEVMKLGGKII